VTRDEYLTEIESLKEVQQTIWNGLLAKYVDFRRCGLGLCGKLDELDLRARKGDEDAKACAERIRADYQEAWQRGVREVEQIEITMNKLKDRADARL